MTAQINFKMTALKGGVIYKRDDCTLFSTKYARDRIVDLLQSEIQYPFIVYKPSDYFYIELKISGHISPDLFSAKTLDDFDPVEVEIDYIGKKAKPHFIGSLCSWEIDGGWSEIPEIMNSAITTLTFVSKNAA